ncbi:MAG: hypothetical protein IT204_01050 [Fimbriimonadaceae bacterium]|nr:hypothetical protein [Fimbriimonadaceae bacterium]
MGERLRRLASFGWRLVRWLTGTLWRLLRSGWQWLSRTLRVGSLERRIRAEERRRDEVFAGLGKMVYLLYKRNLVRNADLLAECEKVLAIDVEIDRLGEAADLARLARPLAPQPAPLVAATPLEMDDRGVQAELAPRATADALDDAASVVAAS